MQSANICSAHVVAVLGCELRDRERFSCVVACRCHIYTKHKVGEYKILRRDLDLPAVNVFSSCAVVNYASVFKTATIFSANDDYLSRCSEKLVYDKVERMRNNFLIDMTTSHSVAPQSFRSIGIIVDFFLSFV